MKKLKGFTLVELLVVIAVIGILSAVVILNTQSAKTKAKEANMKTTLTSIQGIGIMCSDERETISTLKMAAGNALTLAAPNTAICIGSTTITDKYPTAETGYIFGVTSGSAMVTAIAPIIPSWVVGVYKGTVQADLTTNPVVVETCNSSTCKTTQQ